MLHGKGTYVKDLEMQIILQVLFRLCGQLNYKSGKWDVAVRSMDSRVRLLCDNGQVT